MQLAIANKIFSKSANLKLDLLLEGVGQIITTMILDEYIKGDLLRQQALVAQNGHFMLVVADDK